MNNCTIGFVNFFSKIKKYFFKPKYLSIYDLVKKQNKNFYIGINSLSVMQIKNLLEDVYDLIVPIEVIENKVKDLNTSTFSNKMVTINMWHYKDSYKKYKHLDYIIVGNNLRKGVHHNSELPYIELFL